MTHDYLLLPTGLRASWRLAIRWVEITELASCALALDLNVVRY